MCGVFRGGEAGHMGVCVSLYVCVYRDVCLRLCVCRDVCLCVCAGGIVLKVMSAKP